MMYLIYILIGLGIIFGVDCLVTILLAFFQAAKFYQAEKLSFKQSFKKYLLANSDLHQRMTNLLQ